jgi:hypothetical protein
MTCPFEFEKDEIASTDSDVMNWLLILNLNFKFEFKFEKREGDLAGKLYLERRVREFPPNNSTHTIITPRDSRYERDHTQSTPTSNTIRIHTNHDHQPWPWDPRRHHPSSLPNYQ